MPKYKINTDINIHIQLHIVPCCRSATKCSFERCKYKVKCVRYLENTKKVKEKREIKGAVVTMRESGERRVLIDL